MVYLGKGAPLVRQLIHAVISIALRLFFRRIEVVGVDRVPSTGPLLFVLNHPNGLVDPALVFVSLPRRVSFLAKSTLFDNALGAFVLRTLEILPVYRRIDAGANVAGNLSTFENCFELLRTGRCIAIFPEGISHDYPQLQKMKTGAARIALGAVSGKSPAGGLKIVPVGLYYTSKTSFRSEALISYGDVFEVEPVVLEPDAEPPRDAVIKLTAKIESALRDVTLNLETESELETIVRAEALFSSVFENLVLKRTVAQSFAKLKELASKYGLLEREDPERMFELNARVTGYEKELRARGLTTESFRILQNPTLHVFRYLVLRLLLLAAASPLAILGAIVHSPAYLFSALIGRIFRKHDVDVAGSSSTIVAAIGLMPLTWASVASVFWYYFSWQTALVAVPATIACGYIALRSAETLIDMRIWLRAGWLLLAQRGLFLRLMVERNVLQKKIDEL